MLSLLSLFSGAGGLDYAFESTGEYSVDLAVEFQPEFCETLRINQLNGYLDNATILQEDITQIRPSDVRKLFLNHRTPDGVIGGPPCESFAQSGKRMGREDKRGTLVFHFADWVKEIKPKFFLMENVPGIISIEGGKLLTDLMGVFESSGFNVTSQVLNSADFGAATYRKRLIIVGVRDWRGFEFPEPTHEPKDSFGPLMGLAPYKTVRDAIGNLPSPAIKEPGFPQGHVMVSHSDEVRARFAALPEGRRDHIRRRTRLKWAGQSPSLLAGNLGGIRSHIHPSEPRELTNRESARIQGFPDDFCFSGNHAAIGKQIANSVPVPLAVAMARRIAATMAHHQTNPH